MNDKRTSIKVTLTPGYSSPGGQPENHITPPEPGLKKEATLPIPLDTSERVQHVEDRGYPSETANWRRDAERGNSVRVADQQRGVEWGDPKEAVDQRRGMKQGGPMETVEWREIEQGDSGRAADRRRDIEQGNSVRAADQQRDAEQTDTVRAVDQWRDVEQTDTVRAADQWRDVEWGASVRAADQWRETERGASKNAARSVADRSSLRSGGTGVPPAGRLPAAPPQARSTAAAPAVPQPADRARYNTATVPPSPPGADTPPPGEAHTAPRTRISVRGKAGGPFFRSRFGRKDRQIVAAAALLAAAALALPALVIGLRGGHAPGAVPQPAPVRVPAKPVPAPTAKPQEQTPVRVYLSKTGGVETLPLEEYVAGVLAAEMPATFELEALKAQAIAARTFIIRRLTDGDVSGVPGGAADVTDTVSHQAYLSRAALKKWKTDGEADKLARIKKAVQDTAGTIMTYEDKPITASFFSASSGYTENSEEYWNQKIPYLRSVPSPWDAKLDPRYKETVTLSVSQVFRKLGLGQPSIPASSEQNRSFGQLFTILSSTTGHRVKEVKVGGTPFSGREIREKLGLRSSQFRFSIDGDQVKITTYGYGHGVGMSQWGANGMAQEGYTVTQILKHYYTGISFTQASDLLSKKK